METQEQGKRNVNQLFARSFINVLQFDMIVNASQIEQFNPMAKFQFNLHTDAQLSVIHDLAKLVTDRTEVYAEYDRMMQMLKEKAPDSPGYQAMTQARAAMTELLNSATSH
jgi:hypothetical protein